MFWKREKGSGIGCNTMRSVVCVMAAVGSYEFIDVGAHLTFYCHADSEMGEEERDLLCMYCCCMLILACVAQNCGCMVKREKCLPWELVMKNERLWLFWSSRIATTNKIQPQPG